MTKLNDGGPAFPQVSDGFHGIEATGGLSVRDYFAGQALIGLCQAEMGETEFVVPPALLARTAYSMADAMLTARSTPTGSAS